MTNLMFLIILCHILRAVPLSNFTSQNYNPLTDYAEQYSTIFSWCLGAVRI